MGTLGGARPSLEKTGTLGSVWLGLRKMGTLGSARPSLEKTGTLGSGWLGLRKMGTLGSAWLGLWKMGALVTSKTASRRSQTEPGPESSLLKLCRADVKALFY